MSAKKKCVIFDFDGVLYDSEQINYEANQVAFEGTGLSFTPEEYRQLWIIEGLDLPDIIKRSKQNLDPEAIRRIKNIRCKQMLLQSTISNEVRNAIESLVASKWKLAIGSSNTEDNILTLLGRSGMRKLFETVVGLESVSKVKPEPDVFLECLNRTGVRAKNAVVVEDAPKGITAAKRAKIGTIVAIPNAWTQDCDFSHADIVLDAIKDLPEAIK